ncbi:MAG: YceI family protein [Solirubrobacterales bacterium]|jgi:polyisoprenoid-binding protein YceI
MSTATTTTQTAVPAGVFRIDPVHSTVGFEVKHMISTFRGSFREYDATLDNSNGAARLAGSAEVASVDVRDENLAGHLQSPDFFDAENSPRIEFASDDVQVDADGSVTLDGELSIRGVTKPIQATGRFEHVEADMGGGERIGLNLETTVDRRDYGINWNSALPKGGFALGNDVKLVVNLELSPEEE